MKIHITKCSGPKEGQNYAAKILAAPDGQGGEMNIGVGFAETMNQALLMVGAELAERDLPIFGISLQIETFEAL